MTIALGINCFLTLCQTIYKSMISRKCHPIVTFRRRRNILIIIKFTWGQGWFFFFFPFVFVSTFSTCQSKVNVIQLGQTSRHITPDWITQWPGLIIRQDNIFLASWRRVYWLLSLGATGWYVRVICMQLISKVHKELRLHDLWIAGTQPSRKARNKQKN